MKRLFVWLGSVAVGASAFAAVEPPESVARRVSERFLKDNPTCYQVSNQTTGATFNYGGSNYFHYATCSLWVNALECARLMGDKELERRLVDAMKPFADSPSTNLWHGIKHVDFEITGAVPLAIANLTRDKAMGKRGLWYADRQWDTPTEADNTHKGKFTFEERMDWWKKGYSSETRLWIDDMYMISVLQLQAYRYTGKAFYLDRAAKEMALYLDRLPRREGLFFHAPFAPFVWARGDGWMAAAMPMILSELSWRHPDYAKIRSHYAAMMASLLKWQRASGLWGQLVDDPESWDETSGSAMFAFAFSEGVRLGLLGPDYAAARDRAYAALVGKLDKDANLADVCIGTGARDNRDWYMRRDRMSGDPHGQAPLLWLCRSLLDKSTAETAGFDISLSSDRTNAVYRLGETTTFTVDVRCRNGEPARKGKVCWQINNFGDTVLASGERDLKDGATFTVAAAAQEPGFLRLDVTDPAHPKTAPVRWGVVVSPEEIRPGTPYPDDFLDFWKKAVAAYDREVTAPIVTTKVFEDARHTVLKLAIPTVGGRTVYGFLSVPKGKLEKYPLRVSFPGAGPSTWATGGDDRSFLLFVNVHYYDPQPLADAGSKVAALREELQAEEDAAWAKRYPVKSVRYTQTGIAVSREDYFYYGAILAMNRTIDWAIAQPLVDPKQVYYNGTSQGGGLGLILMGLNGKFAGGCIFVPALTDLLSYNVSNRESGWPRLIEGQLDENRTAAIRNAPYFCGANFARHITCPIAFEVGFIDTVCPPHAGYAAFNVTPSREKAMFHGVGQAHSVFTDVRKATVEWLEKKTGFKY